MTEVQPRRRLRDLLGFRLAFVLAVVLLPLTLISVLKSMAVLEESRARSEAALTGETMRATSGELRLIQEARGAATVLAGSLPRMTGDLDACSQALRGMMEGGERYSLIAFVPVDGISRCNSAGREFDFSGDPLHERASQELQTSFAVKPVGLVSGASVLVVSHPVFDEGGAYLGLVSLSIPHSGLRVAPDRGDAPDPMLTVLTFDPAGNVLTASRQLDSLEEAVPADRALQALTVEVAQSFTAVSAAGQRRAFSVVPLVPGELFALGSWPFEGAGTVIGFFNKIPVLFPILMWLASLVVAWLAVERLVTRNVRRLSASLVSFAGGSRLVGDIDMRDAPLELREMAEAYDMMTENILQDEAQLEDMVHQKEVLLREVHHRVKNNLQLIASIMNMQMRRTRSAEAKTIMKGLQDRVMSLATIHRELYQTAGLTDIHSDELLSTIVGQIANLADGPDHRFSLKTDFDDIRLTPDQAVPLALLVAEAMTNAIKYASAPEGEAAEIRVALKRTGDEEAELRLRNTVDPRATSMDEEVAAIDDGQDKSGLGLQLVSAFSMQIGGQVEREDGDASHSLTIAFRLAPLADGEERNCRAEAEAAEPVE
ncbi:Two-component sensor histidine kinase, contains HisKA and HATPase domains [Cribrihabitans marinus]|uniref:histidine kinase n=1 Tax=Cribrihabitans marinus TaxID=1227549 RepID=A0A1H7BGJ9_9RHOB|nr:sensor histidine kinase [Cribrihabitans marinus]GGH34688.1 histidine kinase [Cribrihabitans marinus]SEJ76074.1 Two-component sensor histidine kinase, contains HisKA and HATPase domains [Cribrihabitans marinus]